MRGFINPIVADGLWRLMEDPNYRRQQAAIIAAIRAKHAEALAQSSNYWQRLRLEWKIRKEIRLSQPSAHCLWLRH